jgi:hypothetical protein
MKRTVTAKDECAAAEPEAKRARTDEADEADTVLELDEHQFECVICFGKLIDSLPPQPHQQGTKDNGHVPLSFEPGQQLGLGLPARISSSASVTGPCTTCGQWHS